MKTYKQGLHTHEHTNWYMHRDLILVKQLQQQQKPCNNGIEKISVREESNMNKNLKSDGRKMQCLHIGIDAFSFVEHKNKNVDTGIKKAHDQPCTHTHTHTHTHKYFFYIARTRM